MLKSSKNAESERSIIEAYYIAWRIPATGQSGLGTVAMTRADAEAWIMDCQASTPDLVYTLVAVETMLVVTK